MEGGHDWASGTLLDLLGCSAKPIWQAGLLWNSLQQSRAYPEFKHLPWRGDWFRGDQRSDIKKRRRKKTPQKHKYNYCTQVVLFPKLIISRIPVIVLPSWGTNQVMAKQMTFPVHWRLRKGPLCSTTRLNWRIFLCSPLAAKPTEGGERRGEWSLAHLSCTHCCVEVVLKLKTFHTKCWTSNIFDEPEWKCNIFFMTESGFKFEVQGSTMVGQTSN